MEVERADIPNHVLEHFLMTTQGYEEADAFFMYYRTTKKCENSTTSI